MEYANVSAVTGLIAADATVNAAAPGSSASPTATLVDDVPLDVSDRL